MPDPRESDIFTQRSDSLKRKEIRTFRLQLPGTLCWSVGNNGYLEQILVSGLRVQDTGALNRQRRLLY